MERTVHAPAHRVRVQLIARGGQVDQHVLGGAAGRSLPEEGRHEDVARRVHVAASGKRFGSGDQSPTRLDAFERGFRGSLGRDLYGCQAGELLLVGLAGHLERRGVTGVRLGVAVGQDQEFRGEFMADG